MHSTESRYVMGPENILFAGASVHLTGWSSEGVNRHSELMKLVVHVNRINRTDFGVYLDQKIFVSAQGVIEQVTNVR